MRGKLNARDYVNTVGEASSGMRFEVGTVADGDEKDYGRLLTFCEAPGHSERRTGDTALR